MRKDMVDFEKAFFQVFSGIFIFYLIRQFLRPPGNALGTRRSVNAVCAAECKKGFPFDFIYLPAHQVKDIFSELMCLPTMPFDNRICINCRKILVVAVHEGNGKGQPFQIA